MSVCVLAKYLQKLWWDFDDIFCIGELWPKEWQQINKHLVSFDCRLTLHLVVVVLALFMNK